MLFAPFDASLHCIILTGASYNHVALRIPKGDRPPLDEVDLSRSEGLYELVELMKRCWDGDPTKRPSFQGLGLLTNHLVKQLFIYTLDIFHLLFQIAPVSQRECS